MTQKQTDIIISGAGAGGLTLGILLAKAGLSVAIIDPADKTRLLDDAPTGRTVALMNASLNVLRAAGVWPAIQGISNPLSCMRIIDVSRNPHSPLQEDFDASDIGENQYGFNIPNNALRAALYEGALNEKNITFYLGRKIQDYNVQNCGVEACLNDGAELHARLLVGADGRKSAVRAISGIECDQREYDQSAITFLINHSQSHNNAATEFHRSAGPLALVPLPGNQSSVVWVNSRARADDLIRIKKQDFINAFEHETNGVLGGITLESDPESWPLSSLKAKTLIADRVALVAEAAHAMSPITAQGLNLSLRDVAALAEEVTDAARVGQDIGGRACLSAYAKRRKFDIESRVFGVDGMNRIVSNDIAAIKGIRHIGIKALSYAPPLKRFAMRVGLAPAIDEGRLAKGEAL